MRTRVQCIVLARSNWKFHSYSSTASGKFLDLRGTLSRHINSMLLLLQTSKFKEFRHKRVPLLRLRDIQGVSR